MNATRYRRQHNRQKGECTWCGGPVPKGRRTWCSDACVEQYRDLYDWQYVRRKVEKRDRGICVACGCDTVRLRSICKSVWYREGPETCRHLCDWFSQLGHHDVLTRDQWEADHIVERCRGGGNELSNLRTLCLECHKAETARLARERAAERRAAKKEKTK
jgi:5-methylcytosine-specific restriction protein A